VRHAVALARCGWVRHGMVRLGMVRFGKGAEHMKRQYENCWLGWARLGAAMYGIAGLGPVGRGH
jgi:hypothetical protein